jgi:hypothetical protein
VNQRKPPRIVSREAPTISSSSPRLVPSIASETIRNAVRFIVATTSTGPSAASQSSTRASAWRLTTAVQVERASRRKWGWASLRRAIQGAPSVVRSPGPSVRARSRAPRVPFQTTSGVPERSFMTASGAVTTKRSLPKIGSRTTPPSSRAFAKSGRGSSRNAARVPSERPGSAGMGVGESTAVMATSCPPYYVSERSDSTRVRRRSHDDA